MVGVGLGKVESRVGHMLYSTLLYSLVPNVFVYSVRTGTSPAIVVVAPVTKSKERSQFTLLLPSLGRYLLCRYVHR